MHFAQQVYLMHMDRPYKWENIVHGALRLWLCLGGGVITAAPLQHMQLEGKQLMHIAVTV